MDNNNMDNKEAINIAKDMDNNVNNNTNNDIDNNTNNNINNNIDNDTLKSKMKRIISFYLMILTPLVFLILMIFILNYTTDIWYYLKAKPVIFSLFLLELIHILLMSITRK